MKILVCIKQVPDTTAKLTTKADGSGIEERGFKWVMNPYDEFAVEEALQIKAKNPSAQIHAVSLGPKDRCVEVLRTALAMGCDEAAIIDAPATTDSYVTGLALAKFVEQQGGFDVIFTGKLAIDQGQGCVTQMLGLHTNRSHANIVSKFEIAGDQAHVERDLAGGAKEQASLPLKSVFGANKGLNTPRYASLPGIMKAKKKPLTECSLESLGLTNESDRLQLHNYRMPADREPVKFIEGDAAQQVSAVVQLLREQAKVI